MKLSVNRARLMSGVAMSLGMMVFTAKPAAAACIGATTNNPNDTVDCATNTTTLDTTFPTNFPNDRNRTYPANVVPVFITIRDGVLVDGFGLAITNVAAGTNALTITNDGTIQVNATNTPTAGGGDGALFVTANGNPIIYGGTGNILNLGAGDGFEVVLDGAASLDATIGGSIATNNGNGINVTANAGSTGPIDITTTAGRVIGASGGDGIHVQTAGSGDVTIDSNANIANGIALDLQNAIFVDSTGTGDINITHLAGGVSVEAQQGYIHATINNGASTGDIDITLGGGGTFNAAGDGIEAETAGTGDITIDSSDAAIVAGVTGISALSNGGSITVDAGSITSTGGGGGIIFAQQQAANGTGDVTVTTTGDSSATNGIFSFNEGSGSVTVNTSGSVTALGNAIQAHSQGGSITITVEDSSSTSAFASVIAAQQLNANGNGDVTVTATGVVSGVATGINVANFGTGDVTVTTGDGLVTADGAGIAADIANAMSTGNVLVNVGTGGVTAGNVGVIASTNGTGTVTVNSLGDITSTNSLGIDASSAGRGDVTVNAAGAVSGATGGISAMTQGGSATVTAGDVTSSGAGSFAIQAWQQDVNGDGDVTVTTTGVVSGAATGITAINSGMGDVTVDAAGLVTGTTNFGINAFIDNAGSAGNVVVTSGPGGVTAATGINVATLGTGDVTVNSLGVLSGTMFDGIVTFVTSGASLVNVAGGSVTGATNGIRGTSNAGGTIDVVLSGGADVTGTNGDGILLNSAGAKTVDVGAGSTVTCGINAINALGGSSLTLTNGGTVGTAGQVAVLTDLATAASLTNLAGGVLDGQLSLSDQADMVANGGIWNVDGANAFNGGADMVTNAAGGVINSATGTVMSDLEDLVTLGGSSFNVTGALDFANVATNLTNGGALVLADGAAVTGLGVIVSDGSIEGGAGSSLSNMGNVTNLAGGVISTAGDFTLTTTGDVANAGMLDLAPALFTLAGATSFTNSGTINATGGATGLTIPGLLDNSGAINLSNGVVGDVLTLTGDYVGSGNAVLSLDVTSQSATDQLVVGAVSGTTSLNVNPVGSGITGTDGILVVDADTSTADAFVLGTTGAGLVNYSLLQQGADYYLIGLLNTNAFAPLLLSGVATELWHQSADVAGTHLALKRQDLAAGKGRSGLWGRFYWGRDRSGARHTQNLFGDDLVVDQRVETGRTGAQLGFDYKTGGALIGFTAGYEHVGAEHVATSTGLKAGGYNLGVYGLLGSDTGFYGSLLAKYDHGQARLTNNDLFDGVGKLSLDSWGVDGKAGYRWATGRGRLDVGGGLTWVRSSIEDFAVSGIEYDFATARSLRGQIGVRYEGRDSYGPYVDARLLHEFKDSNGVGIRSGTELDAARAEGRGTWGRLEVGVAPHSRSGPTAAIWAQVGDAHGIGVQAGWKF